MQNFYVEHFNKYFWATSLFFRLNKNIKWIFNLKLLNNYLSSVKDSKELRAWFDEMSQLNIWKLILDVDKAEPFIFEKVIPDILELPNLKANLEELEIKSYFKVDIKKFIKNWSKYGEWVKLNQVTFNCTKFDFNGIFEIKKKMKKYFSQFEKYKRSLICSIKKPKLANKHKSR